MALLLLLLLSLFASPAIADDPQLYYLCGSSADNFTGDSAYSSNLNLLLSTLSSNASAKGFASSAIGGDPDRVYGFAFCRGDIDAANCSSCVSGAASDVQKLCRNNKVGVIWYDYCQLFYSGGDIIHEPDLHDSYRYLLLNPNNVSADEASRFRTLITALMENVSVLAARDASRFFATGEAALTATEIIYGQEQCALDLTADECRSCLQFLVDTIDLDDRKRSMGRRAMGLWCNMRYEFYKFYNGKSTIQLSSSPPPPPPPPPPPTTTTNATHPLAVLSHGGNVPGAEFDC